MLYSISQDSLSVLYLISFKIHTHYILDGWSLSQKLPWTAGSTFDEICYSFKSYLLNNYRTAENITVIFEGYLLSSTKDSTHIWRNKGRLGRKIVPSVHNPLTKKKGDFLVIKFNKQVFPEMFGTQLSASGISIMH